MKAVILVFIVQIVVYSVICINYRAIVQADYFEIAWTDFVIASINFFVIQKIAKSETNNTLLWIVYTIGSVIGSILGTIISKTYL